jgi:hypothetical protein
MLAKATFTGDPPNLSSPPNITEFLPSAWPKKSVPNATTLKRSIRDKFALVWIAELSSMTTELFRSFGEMKSNGNCRRLSSFLTDRDNKSVGCWKSANCHQQFNRHFNNSRISIIMNFSKPGAT